MIMYASHPENDDLFKFTTPDWSKAIEQGVELKFSEFLAMRRIIQRLATDIEADMPDLFPFFATGGIPFMLPVMHVLAKRGHLNILRAQHFHMFPGLAWGGEVRGEKSSAFFVREFGALLSSKARKGMRVRSMDATFTGNALLRMFKVLHEAFASLGERVENATVTIAVAIDAFRARKEPAEDLIEVQTDCGRLFIQKPSDYTPVAPLTQGGPCTFMRNDRSDLFNLQVEFHVLPSIPTEDKAEVIGACGIHRSLGVKSVKQFGRISFEMDNGRSSIGTGGSAIGSNIINWLSNQEDEHPWNRLIPTSQLPPMDVEELAAKKESDLFQLAGLRYYELEHGTAIADALRGLQNKAADLRRSALLG